jgi:putative phosphoesterase
MDEMRIAVLYDIHGNLLALEATLAEIDILHPDLIVVGGDVAGGPMPRATLERLMALGDRVRFVRGNGDREMVAFFDGHPTKEQQANPFAPVGAWAATQITPSQRDFLASFVESVVLEVEGLGPVLFCHGSPRSDEEMITAATPGSHLQAMLQGVQQRVIVCGHTHMQFEREVGGKRVINAGSVGMPYEGQPGAYWLWLGPEVRFHRTEYAVEQAAESIRRSGMPGAEEFAQENMLHPPSASEATAIFEGMANPVS